MTTIHSWWKIYVWDFASLRLNIVRRSRTTTRTTKNNENLIFVSIKLVFITFRSKFNFPFNKSLNRVVRAITHRITQEPGMNSLKIWELLIFTKKRTSWNTVSTTFLSVLVYWINFCHNIFYFHLTEYSVVRVFPIIRLGAISRANFLIKITRSKGVVAIIFGRRTNMRAPWQRWSASLYSPCTSLTSWGMQRAFWPYHFCPRDSPL